MGDRFVGIDDLPGRTGAGADLDRSVVKAFESVFDIRLVPGSLTPDEEILATRLRATKYLSAAWTLESSGLQHPNRHHLTGPRIRSLRCASSE